MDAAGDNAEVDASASRGDENPYQSPTTNDQPTAEPFALPLGVLAMLVVIGFLLMAALIAAMLGIVASFSITV